MLAFQRDDGPYLDIYTDAVYRAMVRCIDPETGWATPSMAALVYVSKMKQTAVRKHTRVLCDELDKFTRVERISENGSEANAFFLNAFATGLVPSPVNAPSDDPLGEARRLVAQQRLEALAAQKDFELETQGLYVEQLKAQLEAVGVSPVPPSAPVDPPSREGGVRANPPRYVKGGGKLGQWGGAKVYHQRSLASVNVRASCSGEVSQRQASCRLAGE